MQVSFVKNIKMPFHQIENINYYTFDMLDKENLPHGIITRKGGISPDPWFSLNFGGTVGDDPSRVSFNHNIAFERLNLSRKSIYDVWQVHGTQVAIAELPRPSNQPHLKADIILSNSSNVTLFMRFADCVPIIIYDPKKKVIGLVHAGWKGTVNKAVNIALNSMAELFQSNPIDVLAVIGPSIGPDHYEVGSNVINHVRDSFADRSQEILHQVNGFHHFDLWGANRILLEDAGVRNIEVAGLCTACNLDDWYSHREENGETGRFGAFVCLHQE